jgi:hypothetical protein
MIYRNTNLLFFSLFLLVVIFISHTHLVSAQNQIQQSPNQLLTNLLNHLEQQMVLNNQDILTNNLTNTEKNLNEINDNLMILIDVFMPLAERLKTLQKQEKTIVNKTQNLLDQYIPLTPEEHKKQNQSIIQEQVKTQADTRKTRDLISQQKQSMATSNSPPAKQQQSMIDKVNQLSEFIDQAFKNENLALNFLQDNQTKPALAEEKKALEQIEKALKLISPPQSKKEQQQSGNQQQQQNQDQQTKNDQEDKNKASQNKPDPKLSAEEALKRLAQLRKKAEDERKKREKKYGVTMTPQQIPVEKDW